MSLTACLYCSDSPVWILLCTAKSLDGFRQEGACSRGSNEAMWWRRGNEEGREVRPPGGARPQRPV